MNVLVSAYACSPGMGSEPGMGWNWCVNLARHCNLFIITEGEFRDRIEAVLSGLPQACHMHFYYIPVSERVRRMCWNQGDWRFYFHYRRWQKRALKEARDICKSVDIDLVHQLNMIGFREPGYLWKLDKPMVWGPIGGIFDSTKGFLDGAPWKLRLKQGLKDLITDFQIRFSYRVNQAVLHSGALISAVPPVRNKLARVKHRDSILIPETGCYNLNSEVRDKRHREGFHILWVGRFFFWKRLDLALQTIAKIKDLPGLHFHIIGTGSSEQVLRYRALAGELGIENICEWHGQVDNEDVLEMMRDADLFLFTSITEATSTVIAEAINNCLPIVCFDTCGFGPLVTDDIGRKVKLSSPGQAVQDFANHICMLYDNRDLLYKMSFNCREALKSLLWEEKARRVVSIYRDLLSKDKSVQKPMK